MPTEIDARVTHAHRVRVLTTHGSYFEVDVRSEELTDLEIAAITNAIRDQLDGTIVKNQIAHTSIVRVPNVQDLNRPSAN